MKSLNLGFSPCPNDTFIFHGMTHNLVDTRGYDFELTIADVEELNSLARNLYCDITKLSFHAWLRLRESYEILDSGAALGYGCGPLVVSGGRRLKEDSVVALPGEWTTAALLFRIYAP
ncbi:MAG TPA: 1,4-dihydroxy-6-naphthoate synthase, partial [Spirochaetota bacterium]|nr:1,4-dihydroxy-6-naphthoate synthase [Spirochaetota bacterium]